MPRAESADPDLLSGGAQAGLDAAVWPLALVWGTIFFQLRENADQHRPVFFAHSWHRGLF